MRGETEGEQIKEKREQKGNRERESRNERRVGAQKREERWRGHRNER